MNSDIIPQGPSEILGAGSIVTRDALLVQKAGSVATLTGIAFCFPATPANAGVVTAADLASGPLYNVTAFTVATGSVYVIYRH